MRRSQTTTDEVYERYHRTLLKGPFFLTQALLPLLSDDGAIVNVGSSSTRPGVTTPGYAAYAAMKGGMDMLTRYLAKELAPRGIRVNAVSPGPTRTNLGDGGFEKYPEFIPPIVAETTLDRLGRATTSAKPSPPSFGRPLVDHRRGDRGVRGYKL